MSDNKPTMSQDNFKVDGGPLSSVPADFSSDVSALAYANAQLDTFVDAMRFSLEKAIVGLPRSLSGAEGKAAAKARAFADRLVGKIHPIPVRLVDERLTTVTATRGLRESGVRGRKSRAVVDQAAAVVILQNALDSERASGRAPGTLAGLEQGPADEAGVAVKESE